MIWILKRYTILIWRKAAVCKRVSRRYGRIRLAVVFKAVEAGVENKQQKPNNAISGELMQSKVGIRTKAVWQFVLFIKITLSWSEIQLMRNQKSRLKKTIIFKAASKNCIQPMMKVLYATRGRSYIEGLWRITVLCNSIYTRKSLSVVWQ